MDSPPRGGIEEQALDRDQAPGLEDADQQGWQATRHRAAPHWTGGMEAHIGQQEGDVANIAEVALRQRASDRRSLIPGAGRARAYQ